MKVVDDYKKVRFEDRKVQFPNRYVYKLLEDGFVELVKDEGKIWDEGTALNRRNLSPAERQLELVTRQSIINYNKNKTQDITLSTLVALITGNVSGDVYVVDFEDINSIDVERGIFDSANKCLYCHNEDGQRINLLGFSITIG